jgi:anti-sigma regulatory factor (Ser/Thr protein kinase)
LVRYPTTGPLVCKLTADAERELPVSPLAPSVAREFLAAQGCAAHSASVLDDAQLLVSELVTNAVEYGGPPLVLRVRCEESEGLVVDVRDGTSAEPTVRLAEDWDEHGRGLALVQLLADSWGVRPVDDRNGDGKVVWFRINPSSASPSG